MVEISNYSPDVSNNYALRDAEVRAFLQKFHLKDISSGDFAKQTQLLRMVPQLLQIQNLLGLSLRKTLSRFEVPKGYFYQQILASALLSGDTEGIDISLSRLEGFLSKHQENRAIIEDGTKLVTFLNRVKIFVEIRNYIKSRQNQFIQV